MLPGSKSLKLDKAPHQGVLESRFKTGFEYSDCWVDDARLVVLYAIDAAHRGADIRTRTEVLSVKTTGRGYSADIKQNGKIETIHAKGVVNAAGPWVDEVLGKIKPSDNEQSLRLVTGSHIVTKKLFDGDHAYLFQNADNRVIFAIPYEHDYTLIGTTDKPYDLSEGPVKISEEEISYLCEAASEYFENDISPEDVVWTYAGVRPLYDDKKADASAVTRDYVLDIEELSDEAPFMSVYGGKITTSRRLGEQAMQELAKYFKNAGDDWTESALLPGGDLYDADFDRFFNDMQKRYPALNEDLLRRLCHAYGTRITLILGDGKTQPDLGQNFGAGLYEIEAKYLINHEWATSAEDILWRRSKLGLHMTKDQRANFTTWFETTLA